MCAMSSWWKADGAMEALVVVIALLFFLVFYCISITHKEAEDRYKVKNKSKSVAIILSMPDKRVPNPESVPFALPVATAPDPPVPREPSPRPPPVREPPEEVARRREKEIEAAMSIMQTQR